MHKYIKECSLSLIWGIKRGTTIALNPLLIITHPKKKE